MDWDFFLKWGGDWYKPYPLYLIVFPVCQDRHVWKKAVGSVYGPYRAAESLQQKRGQSKLMNTERLSVTMRGEGAHQVLESLRQKSENVLLPIHAIFLGLLLLLLFAYCFEVQVCPISKLCLQEKYKLQVWADHLLEEYHYQTEKTLELEEGCRRLPRRWWTNGRVGWPWCGDFGRPIAKYAQGPLILTFEKALVWREGTTSSHVTSRNTTVVSSQLQVELEKLNVKNVKLLDPIPDLFSTIYIYTVLY